MFVSAFFYAYRLRLSAHPAAIHCENFTVDITAGCRSQIDNGAL
ncbi:MAG: hypothetical protein RIS13_235, partial [Bacteroidota bacterium]